VFGATVVLEDMSFAQTTGRKIADDGGAKNRQGFPFRHA